MPAPYIRILSFVRGHWACMLACLTAALLVHVEFFGLEKGSFAETDTLSLWIGAGASTAYIACAFFLVSQLPYGWVPLGALFLFLSIGLPLWLMVGSLCTVENLETILGVDMGKSTSFLSTLPWWQFAIGAGIALVLTAAVGLAPGRRELTVKGIGTGALVLACAFPLFARMNSLGSVGFVGYELLTASSNSVPPTWHVTGRIPGFKPVDNYIVIMGESIRFDGMSLYGNQYKTTPFLDSIPTKTVAAISPTGGTLTAIPLELALRNAKDPTKPDFENSIIQIAREAGMPTHWLDAHGKLLTQSLPFCRMAESADDRFYTETHEDFDLIPEFEKRLDKPLGGTSRLFVLHSYGAHEPVCQRVTKFPKEFKTGRTEKDFAFGPLATNCYFDCYLATVAKYDAFIRQIASAMDRRGQTYSIIVLSDHASAFYGNGDSFECCRFFGYKKMYEVPFVEFGTNVKASRHSRALRDVTKFTSYFPAWIGVTTNKTEAGYDMFGPDSDDPVVSGKNGKWIPWKDAIDSPTFNEFLGGGQTKR